MSNFNNPSKILTGTEVVFGDYTIKITYDADFLFGNTSTYIKDLIKKRIQSIGKKKNLEQLLKNSKKFYREPYFYKLIIAEYNLKKILQ